MTEQKRIAAIKKSIRIAKRNRIIGISIIIIGIIPSAWLLLLAPSLKLTIPTLAGQRTIAYAFLFSLSIVLFGLVMSAISFYRVKKLSKELKQMGVLTLI